MNPYELLKSIYLKTKLDDTKLEIWHCIVLTRWLSGDRNCSSIVRDLLPYMLYLTPNHFFCLLYLSVPKVNKFPFNKLPKELNIEQNPLLVRVKSLLNWSNREVRLNYKIIEQTILKNEDYWKAELGV